MESADTLVVVIVFGGELESKNKQRAIYLE